MPSAAERRDPERRSTAQPTEPTSRSQSRNTVKDKTKEKTFMDRWVEPSLAVPKPSYQDHGGVPYGVLDGMQSLGELPSAKVKARVRPEGNRKSVLGRSSAVAGGADAQETPEGSPAPRLETPQETTPQPELPTQPPVVIDDEKDDDYAPKGNTNGQTRERTTRSRNVKRKSEPASSATPAPALTVVTAPTPTPAPPTPIPKRPKSSHSSTGQQYEYDGKKLKRIVEAAKARAIEVGKPDLAAAVNEIYEQSKTDDRLHTLLEAILTQHATPAQNESFQEYVRAAKKKLKDAKNSLRQQPASSSSKSNGTQEKPQVINTSSPAKPTPSQQPPPPPPPILASAPTESSPPIPSTEAADIIKPKVSLKLKSPAKHQHRRRQGKGVMSVSPRKRAGSAGSDSSLTDLTSNEGDARADDMDLDGPDELNNGPVAPAPPPTRLNGPKGSKDQAAERGSLAVPGSGAAKRSSVEAELEQERDRELAKKKQKLGESVAREYDFQESSVRPHLSARGSRASQLRQSAAAPSPLNLQVNGTRGSSVRGSRAVSIEGESPLSSPATSRQGTPRAARTMAPKLGGKRAKTKQSPEKKQLAGYAGLSGAGGAGRASPIGDDDNEERSENNDFCSACQGSGYLLCCDGCDRSFHFTCLDPPINDNAKELDEPWFCYICVANRPAALLSPEKGPTARGIFAPLLHGLRKQNPATFKLPVDLREFFDGVSTDKNGAFVEQLNGKPTRNRPGYSEEQPDYVKLRDSKGYVHCFCCGLTSHPAQGPKRPLVTCDHCGQHWHLDCLDPPLANPPAVNQNGKKVHDWMCPLHADQELRKIETGLLNRRTIHLRKPKVPKIVQTALTRGSRNNGIIEVVDDSSDDSDSEFYELDDGGTVYKLPAQGIKLDFIDKVKSTRVQQLRDDHAHRRARLRNPRFLANTHRSALKEANFSSRPFNEQQIALQLTQFANTNKDLDLGADQVENLVGTLIAEAPPDVVQQMMSAKTITTSATPDPAGKPKSSSSAVPPSPPVSEQQTGVAAGEVISEELRKELLALQELIRRRLEGNGPAVVKSEAT
ncbi:unnamed protein product [Zymoseptoria tritici ST99CH_1E4]|uniref:PHD-type domain-containing protein n=1 Tax=Zymoseptoria tritici ST99CH_1E4 TaxID=1276532 RepID=A0A2H1GIU7_ZYMTR|nr:unnamed protein product [Zymoseptoria tritici ST99CH_1E4]